MSNLINVIEAWIDDRIMAKSESAFLKRRLDDLEYLQGVHSRDVSSLESEILLLKEAVKAGGQGVSDSDVLQRLDTIDTTVDNITDTGFCLNCEILYKTPMGQMTVNTLSSKPLGILTAMDCILP